MLHDVQTTVQPLVGKNANTLVVQCADDLGSMRADLTKVRQALFNLLSNACKFTKRGTDVGGHAPGGGWGRVDHLPRQRYRHWYDPGAPGQAVSGVLASRGFDGAPVRGHRAGAGDHKQFCQLMGDVTVESELEARARPSRSSSSGGRRCQCNDAPGRLGGCYEDARKARLLLHELAELRQPCGRASLGSQERAERGRPALAERSKQAEAVPAITAEITRELDLTTLLGLITQRAVDLVEAATSGVVYLWDEGAKVLIPQAWHGRGVDATYAWTR